MAERRMLSKRISLSKKINKLSLKAQIVYLWTIPYLDDFGCFIAEPEDIKPEVFPRNKRIRVSDIENALGEEASVIGNKDDGIGAIYLYKVKSKWYQQYKNFEEFQTFRPDRKRISKYPQFKPEYDQWHDNDIPIATNDSSKLREVKLSNIYNMRQGRRFPLKEYLEKMKKDTRKGIQVIALLIEQKELKPENQDQIESIIKRNVRSANRLKGYKNEDIITTMEALANTEWLKKWTLETVEKFIDEHIATKKKKGPKILRYESVEIPNPMRPGEMMKVVRTIYEKK